MKRLIKTIIEIKQEYQKITDLENRQLCLSHHQAVAENVQAIDPDNECLIVAAYLHDIGLYLGLPGKHALSSAQYARTFLVRTHEFSEEEIDRITTMIKVHSDKKTIHSAECEALKQADRLASLF